jgi:hypothetical protein
VSLHFLANQLNLRLLLRHPTSNYSFSGFFTSFQFAICESYISHLHLFTADDTWRECSRLGCSASFPKPALLSSSWEETHCPRLSLHLRCYAPWYAQSTPARLVCPSFFVLHPSQVPWTTGHVGTSNCQLQPQQVSSLTAEFIKLWSKPACSVLRK